MKRRTYIATIIKEETMREITFTKKYAWNSAIRATEQLMRDYARATGSVFTGEKPRVVMKGEPEQQYLRTWINEKGERVTASVWEVF